MAALIVSSLILAMMYLIFAGSIFIPLLVILHARRKILELESNIADISKQLNYIKDHME